MQGILGGTFDPPHNAHLAMAEAAYTQLDLDSVHLMPAGEPWQKDGSGVSEAAHRRAMAKLLVEGVPYLDVDDTEITRSGPSYTVDTLEALDERVVLILGADAAVGIPSWHRGSEIQALADLAIVPRSGVSRAEVESAVGGTVTWLDMEPVDTSSTMVRQIVRSGGDISTLVPTAVSDYIETNRLYGEREKRQQASVSSSRMKDQSRTASTEAVEVATTAATALEAKTGEAIVVLDLSSLLVVTDVFVLATGSSRRNVLTLADETVAALRELNRTPIRKEGTDHGKWVLLDYGDVVVHVFDRETREYYDLERLWAGAPRIALESTSTSSSSTSA